MPVNNAPPLPAPPSSGRLFAARLVRAATLVIAVCAIAWLIGLQVQPGLVLLRQPRLKQADPYCNLWRAIGFGRVQRQEESEYLRIRSVSKAVTTDGSSERWATPVGEYWLPKANRPVLARLLAQQQTGIYRVGRTEVRKGDVVLDCGAHVGVFARQALSAGAQLVVAIEPAPVTVDCLRRNLATEIDAGRAVISPVGVWDSETVLPLYSDDGNGGAGNSFVQADSRLIGNIRLTTIDALVADLKLDRVDFIKLDVKGAAERALRGARETLRRHRPRIVVSTEEREDDLESIIRTVRTIDAAYNFECGRCLAYEDRELRTAVVAFRAESSH